MKLYIIFLIVIFLLFGCKNENKKITQLLIIKPLELNSKYEKINLVYKDSLYRLFIFDCTSLTKLNFDLSKDTIYQKSIENAGFALPINDSINYTITSMKSHSNNIKNLIKIRFSPNYSKIDTNAHIEYEIIENEKMKRQIYNMLQEK